MLRGGVPRHGTRFHHRVSLPLPTLLLVVHLQGVECAHQCTAVTVRSEPHIHTKGEAIFSHGIEQTNHHLPQSSEIGLIIELLAPTLGNATL